MAKESKAVFVNARDVANVLGPDVAKAHADYLATKDAAWQTFQAAAAKHVKPAADGKVLRFGEGRWNSLAIEAVDPHGGPDLSAIIAMPTAKPTKPSKS